MALPTEAPFFYEMPCANVDRNCPAMPGTFFILGLSE